MQSYPPWDEPKDPAHWPHMNATQPTIREAFQPMDGEHRLCTVAVKDGVRYIDNSFATSVNGAWYGLESMPDGRRVHWLVGGSDSAGSEAWSALVGVAQQKVKRIYDIGMPVTKALHYAFAGHYELHGTPYLSLAHAVWVARAEAEPGDIVLLNPGCAPGAPYISYQERGQAFLEAVAKI